MEDNSPPSPPRGRTGKPRAKAKPATRTATGPPGERRTRRSAAPAAPASAARIAPSNGSSEPPPPAFDHLVADDGFVRDFDRLASNNPKSAVTTALAIGVAVGFIAGLLIARD
jgi:hypothetical protein